MDTRSQATRQGVGGLNKSGKILGNGTTHKIRSHLKFTDEKEWKRFSSRRLELIDTFGLSEHKASEQDANIKQIAAMLRVEFNYPVSAAPEFEKLVTAAVQSVRRNRKRSRKRVAKNVLRSRSGSGSLVLSPGASLSNSSSVNFHSPASIVSQSLSAMSSPRHLGASSESMPESKFEHQFSLPPPILASGVPDLSPRLVTGAATFRSPGASNLGPHVVEKHAIHNSISVPTGLALQAVAPPPRGLPLKHSDPLPLGVSHRSGGASNNTNTEPETNIHPKSNVLVEALSVVLSHLISTTTSTSEVVRPRINGSDSVCIPKFLKEEFVKKVRDSCSCQYMHFDITHGSCTIENYTLVELLGKSAINTAVASVVEKTSNVLSLSPILPSLSSLRNATSRSNFLDGLSFGLFDSIIPRDILSAVDGVTNGHKLEIFYLIVGSLMKDFGFDSTLRLLSEITQCYISSFCPICDHKSTHTGGNVSHTVCPRGPGSAMKKSDVLEDKVTSLIQSHSRNGSASSASTGRSSFSSGRSVSLNAYRNNNESSEPSGLNILSTISVQIHGGGKGAANVVQQSPSLLTQRSGSLGSSLDHTTYLDSNVVLPKPHLPIKRSFADSCSLPHPVRINTCESFAPG